eukprot:3103032-Prymnesium_polylepis.1
MCASTTSSRCHVSCAILGRPCAILGRPCAKLGRAYAILGRPCAPPPPPACAAGRGQIKPDGRSSAPSALWLAYTLNDGRLHPA